MFNRISVLRCKEGVNPFYLHFALRLPSTGEQFRKWSTGSSYPAILDEDVGKKVIPVPSIDLQDSIAQVILQENAERDRLIEVANQGLVSSVDQVVQWDCNCPTCRH